MICSAFFTAYIIAKVRQKYRSLFYMCSRFAQVPNRFATYTPHQNPEPNVMVGGRTGREPDENLAFGSMVRGSNVGSERNFGIPTSRKASGMSRACSGGERIFERLKHSPTSLLHSPSCCDWVSADNSFISQYIIDNPMKIKSQQHSVGLAKMHHPTIPPLPP